MKVSSEDRDGVAYLRLNDSDVAGQVYIVQIRRHIRKMLAKTDSPRVVVDLEAVHYMSADGASEFTLVAKKLATSGGALCFAAPRQELLDILRVNRLDKTIPVEESVERAIERMRKHIERSAHREEQRKLIEQEAEDDEARRQRRREREKRKKSS